MSALPPKADMCGATRDVRFVPKADMDQTSGRLSGALDPQVDLAAKRAEIDRLGEKRFSAVLQSFALGIRVAIGGDHDNGDIRSKGLGLG
jgi:hypothetical protein